MRGSWGTISLGAALLVVALAATATAQGNLTIDIDADGNTTIDDPDALVTDETVEPTEAYAWQLNLTDDYHVAHINLDTNLPITEGRQMVPLLTGSHFVEVGDVATVDRPAKVYNLTRSNGTWNYALGLPGPGETNLTLTRDVTPPSIEFVSVGNHTEIGFDVVTDTSEPALATLYVYDDGEQIQSYPTPRPGPWQKFPVQGLDANTTYEVQVNASDWSGNQVTSPMRNVTTAPAPNPPKPIVTPISPEPNATVSADDVVVRASIDSNGSTVVKDGIRLFFDKERVDNSEITVENGTISYVPAPPLGDRKYFVSLEVENVAGGTGIARWSFTAQNQQTAPSPIGVATLVSTLAALAVVARQRMPRSGR